MSVKTIIKSLIPNSAKRYAHSAKIYSDRIMRQYKFKGRVRYCSVCNHYVSGFLPFGVPKRPDAQCPICFSLERDRLVWLFFKKWTNLFDNQKKKMLHVAPEKEFKRLLEKEKSLDYLTADLHRSNVMVSMDITNIEYPESTFDIIYCSHVLEHVIDDKRAMGEFHRVLNPAGWAVIQVPIKRDRTFEDPSIVDPLERLRLFGQEDHVREYGPDYVERLLDSGFFVESVPASLVSGSGNISLMKIDQDEFVYFCTKTRNEVLESVRERVAQRNVCQGPS